MDDARADGEAGVWVVWRQDDHGNQFEVARHADREAARQQAEALEARGHKLTYWVSHAAG